MGHNQEVTDQKTKRLAVLALAFIPFIMTLGNSMLIPILPLMEKEMDVTKLQTSYIITVYSIVAIFCIPIAGYLSDRFGRKKVIIPSLILTGIGGLVTGIAAWKMEDPYTVVLIGRILQGIGASGAMPIVIPLVGDLFKDNEEASATLGIIETSNTVGKVVSPILGSLLAGVIWFLPFLSIPVLSLIALLLIIFFIKNNNDEEEPPSFKAYFKQIKDAFSEHKRWLFAVFIIGAILMFILFGILFYLSNILEDDFNHTGVKKGFLLAIPLLALAITSYISGKVIKDNLSLMKWLVFSGISLSGISVLFLFWFDHFIPLLIIFLICGVGIGASLPSLDSLITKTLDESVRGIITSIYSAMRFIGVAAGPPVVAALMDDKVNWLISLFIFVAVIGLVLAFFNIKPKSAT